MQNLWNVGGDAQGVLGIKINGMSGAAARTGNVDKKKCKNVIKRKYRRPV